MKRWKCSSDAPMRSRGTLRVGNRNPCHMFAMRAYVYTPAHCMYCLLCILDTVHCCSTQLAVGHLIQY